MLIAESVTMARIIEWANGFSLGHEFLPAFPYHIYPPVEIGLNVMVFLVHSALGSQARVFSYSKDNGKAQRFVIFLNHSQ